MLSAILLIVNVLVRYIYIPLDKTRILVQVMIYRRLRIGRDGHLDQSEAFATLYP